MASLLDFFMSPSAGLLSGNVGPTMPRPSGLLSGGFGPAPASDSTLDRLRSWAAQELNPASLGDFPSPQGTAFPSFGAPMEPNPYMRAAASFVPVLGDALDIADVGRRAVNDPASLSGWDALSLLPMVPLATAWHGSPHRFDKFSMQHIGRGEGAQAYGHGLYFAERQGVADSYKRALSSPTIDGRAIDYDSANDLAASWYAAFNDREKAASYLERQLSSPPKTIANYRSEQEIETLRAAIDHLRSGAPIGTLTSGGNLYKVDIPDEAIDRMLDWDAPLSEQPAVVREIADAAGLGGPQTEAILYENNLAAGMEAARARANAHATAFDPGITGKSVYNAIVRERGTQEQASRELLQRGIPGIKYFDGNSRAAGEGTRNFVVFDDELIKILERNGEAMQ